MNCEDLVGALCDCLVVCDDQKAASVPLRQPKDQVGDQIAILLVERSGRLVS